MDEAPTVEGSIAGIIVTEFDAEICDYCRAPLPPVFITIEPSTVAPVKRQSLVSRRMAA